MKHDMTHSRLYRNAVVGLLRGFSQSGLHLEIDVVVPHRDDGLPGFGEFLMVEADPDRAMVGRVCQYRAAGRLMSDQGDSYLADLSRSAERPPAPIVRQMLRYTVKLQLLGQLHQTATGFRFSVGDREFATFGSPVREPSDAALAYLCNVNLEDDPSAALLGELAYGQRVLADVPIKFSVDRLKGRRSFVFARAGYGKSNLIKYLVSQLYSSPPDVGLLIFDVEGEYALPDAAGRPGMVNIPELADRLSLYTNRAVPDKFAHIKKGDMHVDFGDFPPQDIIGTFLPPEKQDLVFANLLRGLSWDTWKELVAYLAEKEFQPEDREMARILRYTLQGKADRGDVILAAIKNNLVPPIRRLHRSGSNIGQKLIAELRQGRIVIADTSLLGSEEAFSVSGLLLKRLFDYNRRHFTDPTRSVVRCLAIIEEAQAVLSSRDIDDRNIFVRWVKEGRKYDLGVILVTQQPGAIADQIISQGDNFFVLHLLNDADLATLKRHNAYFADDILGVIRSEPIPGNCYFWSAPDQPFVLPVRVREFGKSGTTPAAPAKRAKTKVARPKAQDSEMALEPLILTVLGSYPAVWLYPVTARDGQPARPPDEIAFAFDYLMSGVASRLRESAVTIPADDPAEWMQQELPARIEQALAKLGGRTGYALLASVVRNVWVLPAQTIRMAPGKRLRSEPVEVRRSI
jgi:DNA helicase HerA-like ATPase